MNVAEHPPAEPVPWTARRRTASGDLYHVTPQAAVQPVAQAPVVYVVYAQHWYAARAEAAKLFCCSVEDVIVERAIGS